MMARDLSYRNLGRQIAFVVTPARGSSIRVNGVLEALSLRLSKITAWVLTDSSDTSIRFTLQPSQEVTA